MLIRRSLVSLGVATCLAFALTEAVRAQVVVAHIDTGVSGNLPLAAGGYNFYDNNTNIADNSPNNHGTVAARILASQSAAARIMPLKVTGPNFANAVAVDDLAFRYAANRPEVRIVLHTLGASGVRSNTAPEAANAGKLLITNAGNFAQDNPRPLAIQFAELGGIVVGSNLPSTNRAGVTAQRYIVAQGTTEFSSVAGSSFAAPRVAAVAAELFNAYPFLTAAQVAKIILDSARDLGAPGPDPVYGVGELDRQAALNPQGGVRAASGSDSSSGGAAVAGAVVVAGAVGVLIARNRRLKKTLVLDQFERPYMMDLTAITSVRPSRNTLNGTFAMLNERSATDSFALTDHSGATIQYWTTGTPLFDVQQHYAIDGDVAFDQELEWSMSLYGGRRDGLRYQADVNTDPRPFYGALRAADVSSSPLGPVSFLSTRSFSGPALGFADTANSGHMEFSATRNLDLRMGVVNADEDEEFGLSSDAATIEGAWSVTEDADISLQYGYLEEHGSLLGGSSDGPLSVRGSSTHSLGLAGAWRVGKSVSLLGSFGIGRTSVRDSDNSLLHGFSAITTQWGGVGMLVDSVFRTGDQLGIAYAQPLRVSGGSVNLDVPYARDFEGNIYKETERMSLRPEGREQVVETFYRLNLGPRTRLSTHLMLEHQAGHDRNAGTALTVYSTLQFGF